MIHEIAITSGTELYNMEECKKFVFATPQFDFSAPDSAASSSKIVAIREMDMDYFPLIKNLIDTFSHNTS